jgi:hypothetical protein
MIGYPHTLAQLRAGIEASVPGWLERAKRRTDECEAAGVHLGSPFWSEVKNFYRELQGEHKCAFCERKLPSGGIGAYEHDVEHFRPKGRVKAWPAPAGLDDITFIEPPDPNAGFYMLAYHPLNYSVACKACNEGLKKDFFPIEGSYKLDAKSPPSVTSEQPLLIYPLAPTGAKPEDLIVFNGPVPMAAKADGYDHRRARITIEFFKLGDADERKDIIVERSKIIITLKMLLQTSLSDTASAADKADAADLIAAYTSSKASHTNCARCYKRLFESDLASALAVFEQAKATVVGNS